jgi:predicted transcriptional regulator
MKWLRERGVTNVRIAEQTGLTQDSVGRILMGRKKRIQAHNEKMILAVRADDADTARPTAWLPAIGSARRLQALCRMGFMQLLLAERTGLRVEQINIIINLRVDYVRAATAAAIKAVFDELQMTAADDPILHTNGAMRMRTRAINQGWEPPMAWDEDAIDDPDTQPAQVNDRNLSFVEKYIELRDQVGLTDERIAQRLGIKCGSLMRALQRQRIPVRPGLKALALKERYAKEAA